MFSSPGSSADVVTSNSIVPTSFKPVLASKRPDSANVKVVRAHLSRAYSGKTRCRMMTTQNSKNFQINCSKNFKMNRWHKQERLPIYNTRNNEEEGEEEGGEGGLYTTCRRTNPLWMCVTDFFHLSSNLARACNACMLASCTHTFRSKMYLSLVRSITNKCLFWHKYQSTHPHNRKHRYGARILAALSK